MSKTSSEGREIKGQPLAALMLILLNCHCISGLLRHRFRSLSSTQPNQGCMRANAIVIQSQNVSQAELFMFICLQYLIHSFPMGDKDFTCRCFSISEILFKTLNGKGKNQLHYKF